MIGSAVVTGASGFIGSAVVKALLAAGASVIAVSRSRFGVPEGAEHRHVSDYSATPAPNGSVLIHLAETHHIATAARAGAERHREASLRVARDLLEKPYQTVIYASSGAVYGDADCRPHHPDGPIAPHSAYSAAKHAVEELVTARGGTVARLTNVYGPGMAKGTVMSDILGQIPGDGSLRIGNGAPVRDFIWLDDAARGLAMMARDPKPGVYNISTGVGVTIRALAAQALRIGGQADRPVEEMNRSLETSCLVLDSSRTAHDFGWRARTSLDQGLLSLFEEARGDANDRSLHR
jgi:UDP-glucose 4-epimerase